MKEGERGTDHGYVRVLLYEVADVAHFILELRRPNLPYSSHGGPFQQSR